MPAAPSEAAQRYSELKNPACKERPSLFLATARAALLNFRNKRFQIAHDLLGTHAIDLLLAANRIRKVFALGGK